MPIEDFLVDFYSKNTDQEIDQVKIDSIVDYYGGDNVSMVTDLYEKYDTGNIDNDKFLEIKEYYSLDLPKQEEVDVKAEKGAYFINADITLEAKAEKQWMIVTNVNQNHAGVVQMIEKIRNVQQD